jgi:hypothetical protein
MFRKCMITILLILGVYFSCGSSDYPVVYIAQAKSIIKPPDKVEIQYELFIKHLGLLESGNDWTVVNVRGCMGRYQFASGTLDYLGYHGITPEKFKANPSIFPPAMQEQALRDLIRFNENALKQVSHYIGMVVKGVLITKAGLIGAAHLAGAGGVMKFLTSANNPTDMNGTSVSTYLREFQRFTI